MAINENMDTLYELDHIFLCTTNPQITVKNLLQYGFQVGSSRTHHGQGTANAVFYFDNAYFEILWAVNKDELADDRVLDLNLWERTHLKACPFGIAFRITDSDSSWNIPFPTWPYYAPFLPDGANIPIVTHKRRPAEPLIFISSVYQRPSDFPEESRPKLVQIGERRNITRITIYSPNLNESNIGIDVLKQTGVLTISSGKDYLMELELDNHKDRLIKNFSPELPLIVKR